MKKHFMLVALIIWLLCVGSLVAIHFYMHKRPSPNGFMVKAHALFQGLDNATKTSIAHYEGAILRLNDDSCHLVGIGYEPEEKKLASENRVSIRKIDFRIDDPLLFERRLMVTEAFKTLNNAERKCLEAGFASIIFRNGDYYLFLDSKKYPEYVSKYGTECKSCEELRKKNTGK